MAEEEAPDFSKLSLEDKLTHKVSYCILTTLVESGLVRLTESDVF